jgi:hypothetical protein
MRKNAWAALLIVAPLTVGMARGGVEPDSRPAMPSTVRKPYRPNERELREAYERADRLRARWEGRVFPERVTPHWLADDAGFWYRNDGPKGTRAFVLVDAERGTRTPAFDHERLARALGQALKEEVRADRLPFDSVDFLEDRQVLAFRAAGADWNCRLDTYECT